MHTHTCLRFQFFPLSLRAPRFPSISANVSSSFSRSPCSFHHSSLFVLSLQTKCGSPSANSHTNYKKLLSRQISLELSLWHLRHNPLCKKSDAFVVLPRNRNLVGHVWPMQLSLFNVPANFRPSSADATQELNLPSLVNDKPAQILLLAGKPTLPSVGLRSSLCSKTSLSRPFSISSLTS